MSPDLARAAKERGEPVLHGDASQENVLKQARIETARVVVIAINDPVPATPQAPFGGMKESGQGRELAVEGLDAYLETKAVSFVLRDA